MSDGMKKTALLIMVALMVFTIEGLAAKKTDNYNFFRISPFARADGMADAFGSVSDGSFGLYYNPAGLSSVLGYEFQLSYINWFSDINYYYVGLINPDPVLEWGKIGLAFSMYNVQGLTNESLMSRVNTYGEKHEEFSLTTYAVTLASAYDVTDEFAFGFKLEVTSEYVKEFKASNNVFDLGLLYRIINDDNYLRIGVVLTGTGTNLKSPNSGLEAPVNVRFGISDEFVLGGNNRILIAAETIIPSGDKIQYNVGAECWISETYGIRGGYKFGANNAPAFGVGFRQEAFEIDYAFSSYEDIGSTHKVSVLFSWGTPPSGISAQPEYISPNKDGILDLTVIKPTVREKGQAEKLKINIYDEKGKGYITSIPVENVYVKEIMWDGKVDGKMLEDGTYRLAADVEYVVNGNSESYKVPVEIDTTPPVISVKADPQFIQADKNTALLVPSTFTFEYSDKNDVIGWQLEIRDRNKEIFFSTGGNAEPPKQYIWDGIGDNGEYVKTNRYYSYSFIAYDGLNNRAETKPKYQLILLKEVKLTFSADTLFDKGKADVKVSAYSKLKEITSVLKQYPQSEIIVSGHTDNREPANGFKTRLKLSKARADAVKFYMITLLSITDREISTQGYGSKNPVVRNNSDENRTKNRRVEVIIRSTIYK